MIGAKFLTNDSLSRRDAIKLGGTALLALTGCGSTTPLSATRAKARGAAAPNTNSCIMATNVTRGPYFVDTNIPMRSDIRSDSEGGTDVQPGLPLSLKLMIGSYATNGACAPFSNAQVDLWHCNAQGIYSGIDPNAVPGPASSQAVESTLGQNFLRGYQFTDASGAVNFQTIYPGWYQGRALFTFT